MNKFDNYTNKMLPVLWDIGNSKPDYYRVVESNFRGKFTRSGIRKFVQSKSNLFKNAGREGLISVALKYKLPKKIDGKEYVWRSGSLTKFGKRISLFESSYGDVLPEPNYFYEFNIYYLSK